jgi:hypothetical protein
MKTVSGVCQKKPKPKFKLCFDQGKNSSSFYPATNYMTEYASMKTLREHNTMPHPQIVSKKPQPASTDNRPFIG